MAHAAPMTLGRVRALLPVEDGEHPWHPRRGPRTPRASSRARRRIRRRRACPPSPRPPRPPRAPRARPRGAWVPTWSTPWRSSWTPSRTSSNRKRRFCQRGAPSSISAMAASQSGLSADAGSALAHLSARHASAHLDISAIGRRSPRRTPGTWPRRRRPRAPRARPRGAWVPTWSRLGDLGADFFQS